MDDNEQFSVEEPPTEAFLIKKGRPNRNESALLFCSINAHRWCKILTVPYTDENSERSASAKCRHRKRAMQRLARENEMEIEFVSHRDMVLKITNLYAMVTKKGEE